jgi:putative redox protein
VAHATSMGIKVDAIKISVDGDIDLRGFFELSGSTRPGAQQFRVNIKIERDTASKEQINELVEIGKKYSPTFDTLTNGTSVIIVKS